MNLLIHNSLSRRKETFCSLQPPFVGMYVCGPTVYGDAHLGHARPAITFDVVFRYLKYLQYKVRYIRNITDVGHLENDLDAGEDKIGKKARLDKLEPMEIVQKYTLGYHRNLQQLNCLPPSIEPRASGHIIEQIELIGKILDNGLAYIVNGSVYFDVEKYSEKHHYGKLSGRNIDELLSSTRELYGQKEKKNPADFALWKKASKEHIMRWSSPWSDGFPGWHLECSTMSAKYLGTPFDIHGGGMDLLFPHHECEIAQSVGSSGVEPVKYWMHNNMITINGQKMGKSLGNFITLNDLFSGDNEVLEQAYDPMTVRFFILQAHYRSTLDFSNDALRAAEKGYKRLMAAIELLPSLKASATSTVDVSSLKNKILAALNDDFNTPIAIAQLFECAKWIHLINNKKESISADDLASLSSLCETVVYDILGLRKTEEQQDNTTVVNGLMELLMEIRAEARSSKNFQLADAIRDKLSAMHITIKDSNEGTAWNMET